MNGMIRGLGKLLFALAMILILARGVLAQIDERPRVRIVHASPEIQKVDIYLGEILYFRNIYFTYISDYVPVNPGTFNLSSRIPGGALKFNPYLNTALRLKITGIIRWWQRDGC
jgi:hypothetical protein